ncbi:MAG: L-histidine N(alpha)-methyltransferase [Beijerinckiaceae bacterium]
MWTSNKALCLPDVITGPDREFAASVIDGLSKPRKSLPCQFFYDARGSELFEEITSLPEYYPTRTEIAILHRHAAEIASRVGDGAVLVEFGSGSSRKTEILLGCLPRLRAYVPIDVSGSALAKSKRRLIKRFPALNVRPIAGDFSRLLALPQDLAHLRKLGFFPGSTIGNFSTFAAKNLLGAMRRLLAPDGRLIVGVDLKKDARTLIRAYNDAAGVTAAFNLNLLERINRELEGSFDLAGFRHEAIYDPREGRVEMHIVSMRDQAVRIRGLWFRFFAGETIHTENSYKYSIPQFHDIACSAGWLPGRVWTDRGNLFSVHELISGSAGTAVI